MRRTSLALLALLPLAAACADEPKATPVTSASPHVEVEGATIRYDGTALPWDAPTARWVEVLGPCSRRVEHVVVWDDLGVYLHEEPYDLAPESVVVLFGRKRHDPATKGEPEYWPRRTFTGRLTLDGAEVGPGSSVEAINDAKRAPRFRRGHLPTLWRYDLPDGFTGGIEQGHDRSLTAFYVGRPLRQQNPPDYIKRVRANEARRVRCLDQERRAR